MINRELILKFIDKYASTCGAELTENSKAKTVMTITQKAIGTIWEFDPIQMTSKELIDIIIDRKISSAETNLLANFLWIQAETLSEMQKPLTSLRAYENAFQLLHWLELQGGKGNDLKKNIIELKKTIEALKPTRQLDNEYKHFLENLIFKNTYLSN